MNDREGFGGFSLDNIRNWIIKECMESGNPEAFFWNLQEVMEELDDDQSWLGKEGQDGG